MAIAILNLLNETGPSSYRLYIIRCSSLWLLLLVVSIACVCVMRIPLLYIFGNTIQHLAENLEFNSTQHTTHTRRTSKFLYSQIHFIFKCTAEQ